jgi:predicted helicase
MGALGFDEVQPDKASNWLNLTSNDFETLIPVAKKSFKIAKAVAGGYAIFKLFSQGVKTNRDEWVWGLSGDELRAQVKHLVGVYSAQAANLAAGASQENIGERLDYTIKWTRKLKRMVLARQTIVVDEARFTDALYRPFVKKKLYFSRELNEDWYQLESIFQLGRSNPTIAFLSVFSSNPLAAMAVNGPFDYCLLKMGNGGTECLPYWRYDDAGNRTENITDWGLKQFTSHYAGEIGKGKAARKITKESIFHYCYAVLHDPIYREKYAQNLRREFPRIPFYAGFWQWADWGEQLMALHIGYEKVAPYALTRTDVPDAKARVAGQSPKALMRADPSAGIIALDTETTLRGVPAEAWTYKLGNRTALDWVLDQYKERKPKDPTIREKFDTYRFADYKEKVIDLLARVTTVSVETMKIVEQMGATRHL